MLTSSGCSTTLNKRLNQAAAEKGRAAAKIDVPTWPEFCREQLAHAPLAAGAEIRSILKRERAVVDKLNDKVRTCAEHADTVEKKLEGRE
jgi:hypothetical protein